MKNKKIIRKKLNQMEVILELLGELNKTSDCVKSETDCATILLKGLRTDIEVLMESAH
ncbi:hypothetical protein ACOV11_24675 [Vibrio natriegens]